MPKFNDFLEQERLGEKAEVIKNKEPSDLETEKKKDTNMFKAGAAGIASGIIKVQEGIVSLGAELVDLGLGTDNAADVEEFFDKINVFEDTAQSRTAGKLTELFTQIGIPGGIGFKLGTRMANKALAAKRAGKYANLPMQTSEALKKLGPIGVAYTVYDIAKDPKGALEQAKKDVKNVKKFIKSVPGRIKNIPKTISKAHQKGKQRIARQKANRKK